MESCLIEKIAYSSWENCFRLSNGSIELIVTSDVGPRIIRLAHIGGENFFAEIKNQIGRSGEKQWMIRGGHRLWIAPERKPLTYELDNDPVEIKFVQSGIKTIEKTGALSGCRKKMTIRMDPSKDEVTVLHEITNKSRRAIEMAPWALSVMAPGGMAVIPLPPRIPHSAEVLPNQEWTLWGYTDLSDPRFTIGSGHIFFRHDSKKGPNKLGLLQKEGWSAYVLNGDLFLKTVPYAKGAVYPDGNVNFETFSNKQMLELETLGPITKLSPGRTVRHIEEWSLHKGTGTIRNEKDAHALIRPKAMKLLERNAGFGM
jgi:hypothetical protein